MATKAFYSVLLILSAKAVSGELERCGISYVNYAESKAELRCNTSKSFIELYWGVKLIDQPYPVLIIIDPNGERPGPTIASTNYSDRVFFIGDKSTGNAFIEIRNVTKADNKDYLWKINHGAGGYKNYVMSLAFTPETPIVATAASTSSSISPSPTISSQTSTPSSSAYIPTTNSTFFTPTDTEALSGGVKAGIAIGGFCALLIIGCVIYCCIKKHQKKSPQDNLQDDKKTDTEMNTPSKAAKASA